MRIRALAVPLMLALAGCGSKQPAGGGTEPAAAASECCQYLREAMVDEDYVESNEYEMMTPQACADLDGTRVDAAECSPSVEEDE